MKDDIVLIIAILISVCIITLAIAIAVSSDDSGDKEMKACKEIGGHYIVIDKHWSSTSKMMVNEYGCVKE